MLYRFYGNTERIIYFFEFGLPNGLFITVGRHRVMTGVLAVLVSEMKSDNMLPFNNLNIKFRINC